MGTWAADPLVPPSHSAVWPSTSAFGSRASESLFPILALTFPPGSPPSFQVPRLLWLTERWSPLLHDPRFALNFGAACSFPVSLGPHGILQGQEGSLFLGSDGRHCDLQKGTVGLSDWGHVHQHA